MNKDDLIVENIPLIYKCIKDMHCYWKTEDEFQSLYDAGLEGLVRGASEYDDSKGKPSTFLYPCIKNMICRGIYLSECDKRKINKEVMVSLNKEVNSENDTTYEDFVEDPSINIEEEIEKKLELERLLNAVNSLENEKDKLVIKMYYGLDGYTSINSREIAKKWGCSHQLVNIRRRRAIENLKKYMNKQDREAFMLEERKEKPVIIQTEVKVPTKENNDTKNTLLRLNDILFEQLNKLNHVKDDVDFEKEIRKSYAVSQLAQQIVANTNTCIKAIKLAKEDNIDNKQLSFVGINEK